MQGCSSLALQELIVRLIWFGFPSNAMKLTFGCPLPPCLWPGLGRELCWEPAAASCSSHYPDFPFPWLCEQVFSVGLTLSPFLLCQALYWPQEMRFKVEVAAAFFSLLLSVLRWRNPEIRVRFTEAGISAVFHSRTSLSNTTEWPCLCS